MASRSEQRLAHHLNWVIQAVRDENYGLARKAMLRAGAQLERLAAARPTYNEDCSFPHPPAAGAPDLDRADLAPAPAAVDPTSSEQEEVIEYPAQDPKVLEEVRLGPRHRHACANWAACVRRAGVVENLDCRGCNGLQEHTR